VLRLKVSPEGHTLFSTGLDSNILAWNLARVASGGDVVPENLKDLIEDLETPQARKGRRAAELLASNPSGAIPLLVNALRVRVPARDRIDGWVKDLSSTRYAVRQSASRELENLGPLAQPALEAALKDGLPLEARRRVEELLKKLGELTSTPARRRANRGVLALELCDTAKARAALGELANGPSAAWVTREAAAALKRRR
jgi:hypothetical protein